MKKPMIYSCSRQYIIYNINYNIYTAIDVGELKRKCLKFEDNSLLCLSGLVHRVHIHNNNNKISSGLHF